MMLKGSGWALESVKDILIRTAKFCPLGASSYIQTPSCIDVKKCVVNVQNFHDHDCYKYSILAPFVYRKKHRVQSYKALDHAVNFKGLPMPMPLNFISKFEKMNPTFSVNIYCINEDDKSVRPIRVSKDEKMNHRDLLLLQDNNGNKHYCLITSMSRLIRQQSKSSRKVHVCKRCFTMFGKNGFARLQAHQILCNQHTAARVELPTCQDDGSPPVCKFESFGKSYRVPFTIYADIESLLEDFDGCCSAGSGSDNPRSYTKKVQNHKPMSLGCYVKTTLDHSICGSVPLGYHKFSGLKCIPEFVKFLEKVAFGVSEIYTRKIVPMTPLNAEELLTAQEEKVCNICRADFKIDDDRVFDHCHLTGALSCPILFLFFFTT
jgi:hypothetical protein